ncbi:MAG: class I SAM-dependent methyltransferase [Gammaproteobacteria bacterium]|jgi:trans-aconitate methyltransferase|nr:methyltransferase [Chromatiales bacterium]MCP4926341.1 class I SAM-dependent methyltransferase [Gammaproteobacteria bacterium]MDP7153446.1 class I SAM-dependent methyltransferase [Gammaproteobacteria bacterium]MDP7419238.1 class I SAM-dependent methyltransferase [Gammaproteobacteria bacterium]HJP38417.1 class I SAM-dependent methyltransferase [Gammaproteobacteria bacterium]
MEENFYENEEKVDGYAEFTPTHDGTLLIDVLGEYLPEAAAVLELGMGPGKDFKKLSQRYRVTGSDFSQLFLQRYREQDPAADLLRLDARTLETDRTFDAIFSNKALIHLSSDELQQSFERQHELLNDNGLILHSLWFGEGERSFNDLTLVYHNEQDLTKMLETSFDIVALEKHAKMSDDDSIYVLARKK